MASLANAAVSEVAAASAGCLRRALPGGGHVVVGYSGGPDSLALLAVLRLHAPDNISVGAVHVNHGLHADADDWARHCQRRCRRWQLPLQVVTLELGRSKVAVEERARKARLEAFAACAADAVLLAHHGEDQAETCLLRALRGSGVTGLAAMREASRIAGHDRPLLLRPLLGCTQRTLRSAARALRVRGITDPSNRALDCNRNWLRHVVLPAAAARLPGPSAALNKLAANAAQTEQLLDDLARHDDGNCTVRGRLDLPALVAQGPLRVRNWLRWSLAQRRIVLRSGRQLSEAARQLCAARGKLELTFGSARLVAARGQLWWHHHH